MIETKPLYFADGNAGPLDAHLDGVIDRIKKGLLAMERVDPESVGLRYPIARLEFMADDIEADLNKKVRFYAARRGRSEASE